MWRWCSHAALAALAAGAPLHAQPGADEALGHALVSALRPALPFPDANADGTPAGGDVGPVWVVRWPDAGDGRVEVWSNPLNPENRKRALAVEAEIQEAAMRAQRRSQGDYEQALSDFERTGRVSGIREISLTDDGVAGERYDADSHLLVSVAPLDDDVSFSVATGVMPSVVSGVNGPATVIRVPAHVYAAPDGAAWPPGEHYRAEQAWLVFGEAGTATIVRRADGLHVDVTVPVETSPGRGGALVEISGNPSLVEQALQKGDWSALRAVVGG